MTYLLSHRDQCSLKSGGSPWNSRESIPECLARSNCGASPCIRTPDSGAIGLPNPVQTWLLAIPKTTGTGEYRLL